MLNPKCQSCGLVNFASAENCNGCAAPLLMSAAEYLLPPFLKKPVDISPKLL